jgi:hypothetical protein
MLRTLSVLFAITTSALLSACGGPPPVAFSVEGPGSLTITEGDGQLNVTTSGPNVRASGSTVTHHPDVWLGFEARVGRPVWVSDRYYRAPRRHRGDNIDWGVHNPRNRPSNRW